MSSLTDMITNGMIVDPITYNDLYNQYIKDNTDSEGKLINIEKHEDLIRSIRETILKQDIISYECLINHIEAYEYITGLAKFFNQTKRFAKAVKGNQKKLIEYLPLWENTLKVNNNGIEELTMAIIVNYVYDYIKGIY